MRWLKDLYKLSQTVNDELHKITIWLAANKLSLNIKKTHFMIFSTKRIKSMSQLNININGQIIDKVTNTKFLGIIIDYKVNWSQHINMIQNKIDL